MTTHGSAPAAGSRRAVVRDREDAVVDRLRTLGTALDGEPAPEFRATTRARLVAMAAVRSPAPAPRSGVRRLLGAPASGPAPRWRTRTTAGLAAAALTVTAVATLVAVSAGARPGDVLYGLKRGTEQTQLALAGESRGQTLLDLATTRLSELDGLVGGGSSADQALVLGTLRTMDSETAQGASWLTARAVATRSAAPAQQLSTWTSGQSAGLAAAMPAMPAGARSSAERSLELLRSIDVRSSALTTALGCPGGPAVRGTDALGPVPVACPQTGAPSPGTGRSGAPVPSTGPAPNGNAPNVPAPNVPAPNVPAPNGPQSPGGATPSAGPGIPGPGTPTVPSPQAPITPPSISVPLPIPLPIPLPVPLPGISEQSSTSATSSSPSSISILRCLPVIDPAC